ncbi:MAG: hypothetical protein ACKKMR_01310 [Candidatus Nealsonbacteria bacterium]
MRVKELIYSRTGNLNWLKMEEDNREKKQGLMDIIRKRWERFLLARRIKKEIREERREHERERIKKIVPDEGLGD